MCAPVSGKRVRLWSTLAGPPGVRVVAGLAAGREAAGLMVRVGGARVVRLVARVAVAGRAGVAASGVAALAQRALVSSREREARLGVVEVRRAPGARVVAVLALRGEVSGRVVRVGGARVVRLVAGVAVLRRALCSAHRRGTPRTARRCAFPSAGSAVAEWSNFAGRHDTLVWQSSQVRGKPPAWWLGFAARA